MSARKPALPQGLPAATTGGRLASVLSAGLGRLDVNNNDIKRKQASTAPSLAQKQLVWNSGVNDWGAEHNRIEVLKKVASQGYLRVQMRQGERVFVRTFMRVQEPVVWKMGYNGAAGQWVPNPRLGQEMSWIDIAVELEDPTRARHNEATEAMRLKRLELVERRYVSMMGGPIPDWNNAQIARNAITRTIGVNGQDE